MNPFYFFQIQLHYHLRVWATWCFPCLSQTGSGVCVYQHTSDWLYGDKICNTAYYLFGELLAPVVWAELRVSYFVCFCRLLRQPTCFGEGPECL